MKYSKETEQQIKDLARERIVELIGGCVELRKRGNNWVGCCPFHNEKTPSFNVSQSRGFYKCFGCGEHGNTVSFFMKMNGWGYVETLDYLANRFGIVETGGIVPAVRTARKAKPKPTPINYVPNEILQSTIDNRTMNNTFLNFLFRSFRDRARVAMIIDQYKLGQYGTAVTFPQIDTEGNCRYIKAMNYKADGHRDKDKPPFKVPRDLQNYEQVIFGDHLLKDYTGRVAVVEAEKTAVVMAIIDIENNYLWVATGGSQSFDRKAAALSGHDVTIFPDSDEFEQWREIGQGRLTEICGRVRIEDTLYKLYIDNSQEYKNKDIADLALGELPNAHINIYDIINQ